MLHSNNTVIKSLSLLRLLKCVFNLTHLELLLHVSSTMASEESKELVRVFEVIVFA